MGFRLVGFGPRLCWLDRADGSSGVAARVLRFEMHERNIADKPTGISDILSIVLQ